MRNNCVHRGQRVAVLNGNPIYRCSERTSCMEVDAQRVTATGEPFPVCETCPLYAPRPTECQRIFAGFFDERAWGHGESISGPGSSLDATRVIRAVLPDVLRQRGVSSLLDAPCGDHHWMGRVDLGQITYIGADVVPQLIERNRQTYPHRRFERLDITTDPLPSCDAVLVRDCLVHLPVKLIGQALRNIVRSGAKWLIATTFPGRPNRDIPIGHWHPLDLCGKPFGLPEPEELINENCHEGEGQFADKSLGVWPIDDAFIAAAEKIGRAPKLSICVPTFRDWNGLWATVQSLKLHHREALDDVELVVIDNDPKGNPHEKHPASKQSHSTQARELCEHYAGPLASKYLHFTAAQGTAAAKGEAIKRATGDFCLVIDSHVMFPSGTLKRLLDWIAANPDTDDLYHGPNLTYSTEQFDGRPALMGTHHTPQFRNGTWGTWAKDEERGYGDEPFDIDMMATGCFLVRRESWLGFNPANKGFGVEEGTLHGRYRAAGRKVWCLPWLLWDHRFGHVDGIPYQITTADKILNYLRDAGTGFPAPSVEQIREHFVEQIKAVTPEHFNALLLQARPNDASYLGAECPHRSAVILRTEPCELCGMRNEVAPIYACSKHGVECTPRRYQAIRPDVTLTRSCLDCVLNNENQ